MLKWVLAALSAAAVVMTADLAAAQEELGPTPFPVERGSGLPPPEPASAHGAPPEGRAAGGFDFGQWRSEDPIVYANAFQSQIEARVRGREPGEAKADLQGNGFVCAEGARVDCRIEIVDNACSFDWYVVIENGTAAPITGFDRLCRRGR
jgi:hypothetical protein